jgi:hypothetical protein
VLGHCRLGGYGLRVVGGLTFSPEPLVENQAGTFVAARAEARSLARHRSLEAGGTAGWLASTMTASHHASI